MIRALAVIACLAWLYQCHALYPLPTVHIESALEQDSALLNSDRVAPEANQGNIEQALNERRTQYERVFWSGWWSTVIGVIVGLVGAMIAIRNPQQAAKGLLLTSIPFVLSWWWTSGLFEQSSIVQAIYGRWVAWPMALFDQGNAVGAAKVIANDYLLFPLYHFIVIYALSRRATKGARDI